MTIFLKKKMFNKWIRCLVYHKVTYIRYLKQHKNKAIYYSKLCQLVVKHDIYIVIL